MTPLALVCPYCSGRLEAQTATAAQVVQCPQCQRAVTVPGTAPATSTVRSNAETPRSPFVLVEPKKVVLNGRGEAIELRRLTPEERLRYRRRLNWIFAAIGMILLAIGLAVLLRVRP